MGRLYGFHVVIIFAVFFSIFMFIFAYASCAPTVRTNTPPVTTPVPPKIIPPVTTPELSYQTYKSDLYGYSLQFPSDWDIQVDKSNDSPLFKESVNINSPSSLSTAVTLDVTGPIRADKLTVLKGSWTFHEYYIKATKHQFSIIANKMINLSDLGGELIDAYNVEVVFVRDGGSLRSCLYDVVSDNKWFVMIEYTFPDNLTDSIRPILLKSLRSFHCK